MLVSFELIKAMSVSVHLLEVWENGIKYTGNLSFSREKSARK